jgi:hypothetical protein
MKRASRFIIATVLGGIAAYIMCALLTLSVRPSEWEPAIKAFGAFLVIFVVWGFAVEDI